MRRAKVVWSPVEEAYLRDNLDKPKDQLCIALAKTRSALDKKIKELKNVHSSSVAGISSSIPIGKQSRVGKREDLGLFLRSSWEANILRYLKSKYSQYRDIEYEPELFSFTKYVPPKGQALSYLPDFKVVDKKSGEVRYIEVKGNWLRSQDKTKLRRFKKYYPEEFKKLIAVVSSMNTKTARFFLDLGVPKNQIIEYNTLKKDFKDKIKHWEQ